MTSLNENAVKILTNFYDEKVRGYGSTYRGVDYGTPERQQLCFEQLMKICREPDRPFSINDYGCGYGGLVSYLNKRGFTFTYTGYDFSAEMIERANALYGNLSNCTFTTDKRTLKPADYTIGCGIFSLRLQLDNELWNQYILETLDELWALSERGTAFNILTKYSDPERMRPDLYYADPLILFDHCKTHYAKDVALLHDYGVYEFTMLVRRPVLDS